MEEMHIDRAHLSSVTFTNGQGWDEPHPTCEGFTLTTEKGDTVTYSIKPGHHQMVADLPYDERQLALFVLALNLFTAFEPSDRFNSITWVRDKAPTLVDVLALAGVYPEKFTDRDESKVWKLGRKLEAELDKHLYVTNTTCPIMLYISGKDMDHVSLDNGYPTRNKLHFQECVLGNKLKGKPRGFTIKRDHNTTHYSIPEFLHQRISGHFGEQIDIAYMVLAVDKLGRMDPGLPVKNIMVDQGAKYDLGYCQKRMNYWVQRVGIKTPIAAGDLHRFLKYQLMSYTVPHPQEGTVEDDTPQEPLLVPPSWVIL